MNATTKSSKNIHIVMFPWFAFGHMTPFLHLANKLAEKNCTTIFLLPRKALEKLKHLNLHPNRITFHTLTIPHVEGLPVGTETASDIPISITRFLSIAMDRTRDQVENIIHDTKPNLVLYDMAHWVPEIAKPLGIKTMYYSVVCAVGIALSITPICYSSSSIDLNEHEENSKKLILTQPFGEGITLYERVNVAIKESDVIALRTCYEVEGKYCEHISSQYKKPVFLTGHVLPELDESPLENSWAQWLYRFEPGSVIYCAFGSQAILGKKQFQELVLGFEMTGMPFLVALKPPAGALTIEEALPEGFKERVKDRGVVWGGWVQQVKILKHPSIGCFVSHCGFGSMWESLMSNCQIVLVPNWGDQLLNTRLLSQELKVGVEVVKDENDWFSKEDLCKAIKCVMDKDSEVGATVKRNHANWRQVLSNQDFMTSYIDNFVKNMQQLVK